MPRNWSDAVLDGTGPVPQQEEFGSDQPTLANVYRLIGELFDKPDRRLDELKENLRATDQRVGSLEQDAWQPRLAMEADVPAEIKTCERTHGGATKAVQAMHGDSFSANRVDPDPMCSISFGVKAEPLAFPCRDDVLVENDAAAPKLCLSPLKMRTTTAAGGLLPIGKISTATRTPSTSQLFGSTRPRRRILRGH